MAITVVSIAQEDTSLVNQVSAFQTSAVLTTEEANTLLADLSLSGDDGDVGHLQSFLNHVQVYVDGQVFNASSGRLPAGAGRDPAARPHPSSSKSPDSGIVAHSPGAAVDFILREWPLLMFNTR